MTKNLPLVFIDTNIFLDFYRSEGEAGISLLRRIDSLHEHLITTDQVEVEFMSNRQKVISGALQLLKAPSAPIVIPAYLSESATASSVERHFKSIRNQISTLKERFEKLLQNPTVYDPVFKVFRNLTRNESPLNLRCNKAHREDVLHKAHDRFLRGYPPRKRSDTSMGDAINWEWTLVCVNETKRDLVIVSRDGDYGLRLDGKHYLNDWLVQEFKERAAGRRKIEFTTTLSSAFKLLDVQVTNEEEEEEEKIVSSGESGAANLPQVWCQLLEAVGRASPFTRTYLLEAHPVSFSNNLLVIGFDPEFEDHFGLIDNARNHALLQTKLSDLGFPLSRIRFVCHEAPGPAQ